MDSIQSISDYDAIRILSDPRRLAILRALMAASGTLTQLGQAMDMHPARIRYHLMLLQEAGLVSLVRTQVVGNYTEKYYRATAIAFNVQVPILPQSVNRDVIIASGSHDLALELLAETLSQDDKTPAMYTLPVGSLDGLIALRQGLCQMAGCHLFDPLSGEYNLTYVQHLFPGQAMHVVALTKRQQGLCVAMGNPQGIKGLDDLARGDLRFINRRSGSGTRLWFDQQLTALSVSADVIQGYDWVVDTHLEIARAVAEGQADLGLAVLAASKQYGLDFIPLFEERYDLVIPEANYRSAGLAPLLDYLHSGEFRQAVEHLDGYDPHQSGSEILIH